MAYIDNAAYDLSAYEPKKEQQRQEVVELRVVKRNGEAQGTPIKVILGIILAVSLTISMIYNQVALAEVSDEINSARSELVALQDEGEKLREELDSAMSIKNIEKEAEALGMVKIEKDRVHYITIDTEDVVESVDNTKGTIVSRIKEIFSTILEYVGV